MPVITTEDLALLDECERKLVNFAFEPPRISIATALNEALRVGLLAGDPVAAKNHLMERAANPGFAITAHSVYDIAVHHAALIELIVAYLLNGEGAWKPAQIVSVGEHRYKPLSFVMPDHRLRRVVLCSRWDDLRAKEEVNSWRSLGDVCATGRPMLINAISIGSAVKGFRTNQWTRGFIHPVSRQIRIQSKLEDGEGFNANWRRTFREVANKSCDEWLTLMQADRAFEGIVNSITVEIPSDGEFLHAQLERMLSRVANVGEGEMRRSACFKLSMCECAGLCHHSPPLTPGEARWKTRKRLPSQ